MYIQPVHRWRITKYGPDSERPGPRDPDEWTFFAQVGTKVSMPEYERVEGNYITALRSFCVEGGIGDLRIWGLEAPALRPAWVVEGGVVGIDRLDEALRALFRETWWCRLEAPNGYVHVGWDMYSYVGAPRDCPKSIAVAAGLGLTVQERASPYCEEDEED